MGGSSSFAASRSFFCIWPSSISAFALIPPKALYKDVTQDEDQVDSPGLDARSELLLGMMGAELIDKEIEKEKKESERRRYESLYWQEAARDKNRHD